MLMGGQSPGTLFPWLFRRCDMKIFITGVTGRTGNRTARAFAERGDEVAGLHRRPEQKAGLADIGVRGIPGDLAAMDERQLAEAMRGAEAVVYAAGSGERDADAATDAIDGVGVSKAIAAAKLADIRRFLLVSVFPEAGRGRGLSASFEHYIAVKKQADMALSESDLDWIILRPGTLTDAPGSGRIHLGPAIMYGEVSRDDVAATIVELVHTPTVSRRILEVTAGTTLIAETIATRFG